MGTRDPRIDAYIDRAAEFARPVLRHVREVVHEASPDIEETIKWGFPHFCHQGILCSMAAFKEHCAIGFWKGKLILPQAAAGIDSAMGQFGRIRSLADLPPRKVLVGYVRKALELNKAGTKAPRPAAAKSRGEAPVPEPLGLALRKNPAAKAAFERFSPSQRREYSDWIAGAKQEATRKRRLETAVEWIAEGKPRHWKYMKQG